MGHATHHAIGDIVAASAASTSSQARRHAAHQPASAPHLTRDPGHDFESFSTTLLRDLAPRSALERVLVDRLILAAWRLHLSSLDQAGLLRDGETLAPLSRDDLRAERSLETALDLLETARAVNHRWGHAAPESSRVDAPSVEADDSSMDIDEGPFSNEWPVLPDNRFVPADEESSDAEEVEDEGVPARWQDRLVFDVNVSDSSPVVKGTWVTVRHIVSMIVDGWFWSDILRTHPELTEDDVRMCLAYTVEQDNTGEY